MKRDDRNPHHGGSVVVQASNEVHGPQFTSIVGLAAVVAIGMGAALAIMRALDIIRSTGQGLIYWVMTTVLVTGLLLYGTEVTVSSHGYLLQSFGREVWIPWSNVRRIEGGVFGAKFIFEEPQLVGFKRRSKFGFAGFDPMWRKRRTVRAILAGLAMSQSGTEASGE